MRIQLQFDIILKNVIDVPLQCLVLTNFTKTLIIRIIESYNNMKNFKIHSYLNFKKES